MTALKSNSTTLLAPKIKTVSLGPNLEAHCVLSYNHPELTKRCLEALVPQLKNSESVLLVHNGSLEAHRQELRSLFPQIQHLELPENVGFSGGANAGLSTLFDQGVEKIFFHTNDTKTIMLPNHQELHPGLYAPIIWRRQTGKMDSCGGFLDLKNQRPHHCSSLDEFTGRIWSYSINLEAQKMPYVPGTAFLVYKSIWKKVGPFDITYHTYWEDIDWCYRAWKLGIYIGVIPHWHLQHGVGKTCHKKSFYTRELYPRNRQLFFDKHFS